MGFPMLSAEGVFDVECDTCFDSTDKCITNEVDIVSSSTTQSRWLVFRYGPLGFLKLLAKRLQITTPHLDGLMSPALFQVRIREIVSFYSFSAEDPISPEDAFNLIRLHVFGGGVKAWIAGFESQSFKTWGGCEIGKTTNKPLKNNTKQENGFWRRPWFLNTLVKEFDEITTKLFDANPLLQHILCSDISDDSETLYVRKSKVVTFVISSLQAYAASAVADVIIPAVEALGLSVSDMVISPRGVRLPGVCDRNRGLHTDLLDYGSVSLYKICPTISLIDSAKQLEKITSNANFSIFKKKKARTA